MILPQYTFDVTYAAAEQHSFTDRATGQQRSYTVTVLSGFSREAQCIFNLKCPDSLQSIVSTLRPGFDVVRCSLRSFECKNGLVEGYVDSLQVLPSES